MSAILNFERPPLPFEKMKALLPTAKKLYQEASPFPHIVFDDFFDAEVAEKVLSEFTGKNDIDWIDYYDGNQGTLWSISNEEVFEYENNVVFLYLTKLMHVQ